MNPFRNKELLKIAKGLMHQQTMVALIIELSKEKKMLEVIPNGSKRYLLMSLVKVIVYRRRTQQLVI
jgi:hypothetical protein